jgi:hypothetical protein
VVLSLSSSTMTPVRRRLSGGAGGRLVRAGGAVVVLQAVSGFSRGPMSVAMVTALLGVVFPAGAPLRAIVFLLHGILGVKTQFFMGVRQRCLASCPPWRRSISRPALVWQW